MFERPSCITVTALLYDVLGEVRDVLLREPTRRRCGVGQVRRVRVISCYWTLFPRFDMSLQSANAREEQPGGLRIRQNAAKLRKRC